MSPARLVLRRVLRRLGAPGIAGVGVLAACAAMLVSAQRPLEARLERLRAETARAEPLAVPASAPRLAPQDGLAQFYGFFATGVDAEEWLARVQER